MRKPVRIDQALVEQVATLARLDIRPEEVDQYLAYFQEILDYVAKLNELDTTGIEPLSHPLDLVNVTRPDEPAPSLPREEVLRNAPDHDEVFFKVPRVIE